jgi:hypothetical protein
LENRYKKKMRETARGKNRGEKRGNNKREKVDLALPNSRRMVMRGVQPGQDF